MSTELDSNRQSRRNFLVKLGLGVTALAGVSSGLVGLSKKEAVPGDQGFKDQDFPGEGSIFHPARDPRTDRRRVW